MCPRGPVRLYSLSGAEQLFSGTVRLANLRFGDGLVRGVGGTVYRIRVNQLRPGMVLGRTLHHEWQNGGGYPRSLRGSNRVVHGVRALGPGRIHLLAEISAVADVYDALSSDRPYRSALPPELVIQMIRQMAGTQLNWEIVAQFLSILPVFPVGIDVIVTNGKYRGFRGVVSQSNPAALDRPKVRLVLDARRLPIGPIEIDLAGEADAALSTSLS